MTTLNELTSEYNKIVKEYEVLNIKKHPDNNPSEETILAFYSKCYEMGKTGRLVSDKRREMLDLERAKSKRYFLCKEGTETFKMKAKNREQAEVYASMYNAVVIKEIKSN